MALKHTIKFDISRWKDWAGILNMSFVTAVFVIVVVILLGLSRRRWANKGGKKRSKVFKSAREGLLAHNWLVVGLFSKPTYCNVCDTVRKRAAYLSWILNQGFLFCLCYI